MQNANTCSTEPGGSSGNGGTSMFYLEAFSQMIAQFSRVDPCYVAGQKICLSGFKQEPARSNGATRFRVQQCRVRNEVNQSLRGDDVRNPTVERELA